MKEIHKCALIVCLSTLLLVGCTVEEVKNDSDSDEPFIIEYEGQEYKVYTYFEEFLNYADRAEEQPGQFKKHYKETVTEPFRKRSFAEAEGHATIAADGSFKPPQDLEQIRKDVHILQERKDNIHEWVKQSLLKSTDTLPSEGTDVHIFPVDTGIPDSSKLYRSIGGATGKTYSQDSMVLRLTASFEKRALLNLVAHEYHHTVAYEKNV